MFVERYWKTKSIYVSLWLNSQSTWLSLGLTISRRVRGRWSRPAAWMNSINSVISCAFNAAKSFRLGSNALIAGNDDLVQTHGLRSNDDFASTVKCIQILCGEDMLETCGQESFLRNIQVCLTSNLIGTKILTFQLWKNMKKQTETPVQSHQLINWL